MFSEGLLRTRSFDFIPPPDRGFTVYEEVLSSADHHVWRWRLLVERLISNLRNLFSLKMESRLRNKHKLIPALFPLWYWCLSDGFGAGCAKQQATDAR